MNLGELRAELRGRLDDLGTPPLWSDVFLDSAINEAQREACERARLLRVETSITVAVGDNTYSLDPGVIEVDREGRITIAGKDYPIVGTSREVLNSQEPNWRNRTGRPENFAFVLDDPSDPTVVLSRLPTVAGTLKLGTVVEPVEMTGDTDEPQIDTKYHKNMLLYAEHRAYSTRDADKGSEALATSRLDQFERWFGPKPSAKMRRMQQTRHTHVTAYNSF